MRPSEPIALFDPPLAAPSAPARAGAIVCRPGAEWDWLRDGEWRLWARPGREASQGRPLRTFLAGAARPLRVRVGERGQVVVPFSFADAYTGYVGELWARGARRRALPPGALDLFYRVRRLIPRRAQLAARRGLIRWQGRPRFPRWPWEEGLAELLRLYVLCALEASGREQLAFRWFWPRGARAALILTHDVESAAGLRNAIRVADLEQERGLRSSFNLVACDYPLDRGILRELSERGFELGLHGIHHDRSLFSSRREFERQLPLLREWAARLGASGFRSPATHRVWAWLGELPVDYDCTVPISDPYEPQPGGCCSPWPFFVGEVIELPYTLPQDHTTFTLLGERSIGLWLRQLERVEAAAGLAQCVSHPDPGYLGDPAKEALYREFLDAIAARPGLWRALPREVAAWWRRRDRGRDLADASAGVARRGDAGEVSLAPAAAGQGPGAPAPPAVQEPGATAPPAARAPGAAAPPATSRALPRGEGDAGGGEVGWRRL